MENTKMDRLVAGKIMGWKEVNPEYTQCFVYTGEGMKKVFEPSINIEHAWEVIAEMRNKGFYSTHTDLSLDSGQEWWSWHFTKGTESFSAQAKTAALAICKAALEAKGVEVNV